MYRYLSFYSIKQDGYPSVQLSIPRRAWEIMKYKIKVHINVLLRNQYTILYAAYLFKLIYIMMIIISFCRKQGNGHAGIYTIITADMQLRFLKSLSKSVAVTILTIMWQILMNGLSSFGDSPRGLCNNKKTTH